MTCNPIPSPEDNRDLFEQVDKIITNRNRRLIQLHIDLFKSTWQYIARVALATIHSWLLGPEKIRETRWPL